MPNYLRERSKKLSLCMDDIIQTICVRFNLPGTPHASHPSFRSCCHRQRQCWLPCVRPWQATCCQAHAHCVHRPYACTGCWSDHLRYVCCVHGPLCIQPGVLVQLCACPMGRSRLILGMMKVKGVEVASSVPVNQTTSQQLDHCAFFPLSLMLFACLSL